MGSPSETSSVWRKTWKKEELYEQQCIHAVLRRMWLPSGTTPLPITCSVLLLLMDCHSHTNVGITCSVCVLLNHKTS